jgi:hypothetical protein
LAGGFFFADAFAAFLVAGAFFFTPR